MKFIYIISFFFISFYSRFLFADNIAVINIQYLIENNDQYKALFEEFQRSQEKYFKNFEIEEIDLKLIFDEIEESKLILSENEINIKIDNYNKQLNNFTIKVENFNLHFENQIENNREIVLKEIIELLEKYAIENNIDLIIDANSYLIASNKIDITENIYNVLKEINLQLEFKDFE